jgi:hypothetical protein
MLDAQRRRRTLPAAWRVAHGVSLGIGGVIAGQGVIESIQLAGTEPRYYAWSRTATCVPLLALTATYALTAVRTGTTWRALPFFATSYVVLGLTVVATVQGIMKGFAPDEPTVGRYVGSIATLLVVLLVVAWLALNAHRAARAASAQGP